MENLLSQAAAELTIRSEVKSALTALLQDVEHAYALESSLHAFNELHVCREQLAALKVCYDDREAAWAADLKEKDRLGVLLLEEVVKLSAREVKSEKRRSDTEAKLRQLEDEKIKDTAKFNTHLQQQHNTETARATVEKDKEVIKQVSTSTKNDQESTHKIPELDHHISSNQGGGQHISEKIVKQTGESPTDVDERSRICVSRILDEATLMTVFSYIDPLDVMNFAQANKTLLAKVNVMFGTGDREENVAQQHINRSAGDASSLRKTHQSSLQSPHLPASQAECLASISSPEKPSGTSGLSGPTHKRAGSGVSVSTAGSGSSANPFSQVSSWFSGNDTTTSTNATSAKSATAHSAATGSEIKLNAAMANSMALKLSPAELSVIVQMRKNLQKCEAEANKWRLEKEDAIANLASVEAVKDFLVSRVRDLERMVQSHKEEMTKIQKKNLEDQEVIVFLDEKVKELEKVCSEMKLKEDTTKKESMVIVNKHEKKSRVLTDMLRFEREQMAVNEREWKAAKKLLVKEVKNCRVRIVRLEAEVEGYQQQNTQLKSGLMGLTNSSGGISPRGKKTYRSNGTRY